MVAVNDQNPSLDIRLPLPDERVFRYKAMDDILQLLSNNPHAEFTVRELRSITENSPSTVKDSLELLREMGLIEVRHEGKKKLVQINRLRLSIPDDPILQIPQQEFRDPVKSISNEITDNLDGVLGVIVFGSVARGEADRASDIDVWVLVDDERATNQHKANKIAKELGERRFEGDRYGFQVLVESVDSAGRFGEDLHEIFTQGIVVYGTEELDELKEEVLKDG